MSCDKDQIKDYDDSLDDSMVSLGPAKIFALGEKVVYFATAKYNMLCVPQSAIHLSCDMVEVKKWQELIVKQWFADIVRTTVDCKDAPDKIVYRRR